MACEVFKILNNIAPTFIQNIIMLKCSQYCLRKDKTAVVAKANTSKNMDLNHSPMMGPGCCIAQNPKLRGVLHTDPKLGWPVMQLLYM